PLYRHRLKCCADAERQRCSSPKVEVRGRDLSGDHAERQENIPCQLPHGKRLTKRFTFHDICIFIGSVGLVFVLINSGGVRTNVCSLRAKKAFHSLTKRKRSLPLTTITCTPAGRPDTSTSEPTPDVSRSPS